MLHLFLYAAGAFLAFLLLALTWPMWLILLVAVVAYSLVLEKKHPLAKAAESLLGPTVVGCLLITIVLLVMNLAGERLDANDISATEHLIWTLHHAAAKVRLDWWVFALVIGALLCVSAFLPEWEIVSRSLTLKKRIAQVTTALAVASSFVFVATKGVVDQRTDAVARHLTAVYQRSAQRTVEEVQRYLIAQSIRLTAARLEPSTATRVARIVTEIAVLEDPSRVAQTAVARSLGDVRAVEAVSSAPRALETPAGDLMEVTKRQLADERRVTKFAEQAKAAVKAALGEILKLPAPHARDAAMEFFGASLGHPRDEFRDAAERYLQKATEQYIIETSAPLVDRVSSEASGRLTRSYARVNASTDAQAIVHERLERLYAASIDAATKSSDEARDLTRQAKAASESDRAGEAAALAERANNTAQEAERAAVLVSAAEAALGPAESARIAALTETGVRDAATIAQGVVAGHLAINLTREAEVATTLARDMARAVEAERAVGFLRFLRYVR